jgi:hypothetical protein
MTSVGGQWRRSAKRWMLAVAAVSMTGCASYPDVRSATYATLGPAAVVMRPATQVPTPTSVKYKSNEFPFVPGSVTRPLTSAARDDERGRSGEWGVTSARRCYPSARVHRLGDTGPVSGTGDIVVDYVLDLSLWGIVEFVTRGAPQTDHARVQRDFGLSKNDLRFVRRVKIGIRNIQYYEATTDQLARARDDIFKDADCRRLVSGKGAFQIVRMYAAQVYDVDVEVFDGASVDLAVLKGKILSGFTRRVRGANVFFALEAAPLIKAASKQ